jgi:SSS family solute:Na+ symporter
VRRCKVSSGLLATLIIFLYLFVLSAVGYWAWRHLTKTKEDFVIASRTFKSIVLFSTIFATNITAFALVGAPGLAYHGGFATYGYIIGVGALMLAFGLYLTPFRLWVLGKRYGYLTPGEAVLDRFNSKGVQIFFIALWIITTVPYVELNIIGSGKIFEVMTKGIIPYWLGCLIPTVIVAIIAMMGGARGTGWTNVLQTFIFGSVLIGCFFFVAHGLGGFTAAAAQVPVKLINLAGKGPFVWQKWFSFSLLITGFCVVNNPPLIQQTMAAGSDKALKNMIRYYPLGMGIVFGLAVFIGAWGSGVFPGLVGAGSDKIMPMMISKFAPAWMGGIVASGVLAAALSTLIAQLLTLSAFITNDWLADFAWVKKHFITTTRIFIIITAIICFLLALFNVTAIVRLGEISWTGWVCMGPALVGLLWWKRANKWGTFASLGISCVVVPFYLWGPKLPEWATLGGFLPVVPCLIISVIFYVIVTLLTSLPPQDKVKKWWDDAFDKMRG